jgi:PAS domain S-box-containing protein
VKSSIPTKIESELLEAIERLNCGVVARDADFRVVFANERLLSWLGYSEKDVVGHPVEKLIPPELAEPLRREAELIASGDVRARIGVLRRADSTTFPVLMLPQLRPGPPSDDPIRFSVLVDLGTVQTAKPVGSGVNISIRGSLDRIALELQSLGLASAMTGAPPIPADHPGLAALSERQREVLLRLMQGDRVPNIAKRLHISPHTVRNHLKAMFREFHVRNQSELIDRVRALRS